jgi:hypothetical protein
MGGTYFMPILCSVTLWVAPILPILHLLFYISVTLWVAPILHFMGGTYFTLSSPSENITQTTRLG